MTKATRPEAAPPRVLVVDDDQITLLLLGKVIRKLGLGLSTAVSAEAAIESFEKQPFDIVFTDIMMPGQGGSAFASWLVQKHPAVRLIVTSSVERDELDRLGRVHNARCLHKPFTAQDATTVLQQVLSVSSVVSAPPRVLVVDDDQITQLLLGKIIRKLGFWLSTAMNAEAAIESFEREPCDIVYTDILMPGYGGVWLIERLRREHPSVQIIAASASVTRAALEQLANVHQARWLHKPFTAAEAVAVLQQSIS